METPRNCQRCSGPLNTESENRSFTMSWWNEQLLCLNICKKEETILMRNPKVRDLKEGCGLSIEEIRKIAKS